VFVRRFFSRNAAWQMTVAGVLMAATVIAYLAWRDAPLPSALEGQMLAWRFQTRGAIPPPPQVAVIAIDDASITAYNRWPLPRSVLADAVSRLTEAGANAIGLDLLLLDEEAATAPAHPGMGQPNTGDQDLAEALAKAPVVLPLAFTFEPGGEMDEDMVRLVRRAALSVVHHGSVKTQMAGATGTLAPIAPLREQVNLGHVNVLADQDGVLRQIHLALPVGGRYIPAFPLELTRLFHALPKEKMALLLDRGLLLNGRLVPTDAQLRLPLLYYGPPKTIPTYSLVDLVNDRIPRQRLAGRAVLIGATAVGAGDTFVTPFSLSLPGVEALATVTANLISGQILQHGTTVLLWDITLIVGFGLAAFAIGHLPSPFAAAGGFIVLSLLLFIVAQLAFQYSLVWLNLSFALLSILLNTSFVALSRIVQERRGRRDMERQKSNLSRYHSPMIADLLAHGMPETAGRRQLAAIMFIDLADFTARCETMAPEVAADFLRAFHGRVERVVLAHGGMLDQFLGDGAMVIFGIRGAAPQDPVTALACGRRLLDDISDWSRQLETQGQPPLVVRVGIHYGPVVISRLGGSSQMHFSAAGDTVNVAARLESIGRSPTSTISISSALAAAVQAQGRHDLLQGFTELPPQPIRGRSEKLSVWTLQHANAA
jgi:adenylate cyclase